MLSKGTGQIQRRVRIGRVECPRFTRMFVDPHIEMQRLFDVGHRTIHIQERAIGMLTGDAEVM